MTPNFQNFKGKVAFLERRISVLHVLDVAGIQGQR